MKLISNKLYIGVFLIGTFFLLGYFNYVTEQEMSHIHATIPVSNSDEGGQDESSSLNPIFEYKLVKTTEDKNEGYVIETYQEFEIYKDENGIIYKSTPTKNYHYLKYTISDYKEKTKQ
ncbi:hypothetical protein ACQKCU_21170 [Heyndrickxia sporothermodurans]